MPQGFCAQFKAQKKIRDRSVLNIRKGADFLQQRGNLPKAFGLLYSIKTREAFSFAARILRAVQGAKKIRDRSVFTIRKGADFLQQRGNLPKAFGLLYSIKTRVAFSFAARILCAVQGAKKIRDRSVLNIRKGADFLQQRGNAPKAFGKGLEVFGKKRLKNFCTEGVRHIGAAQIVGKNHGVANSGFLFGKGVAKTRSTFKAVRL